MIGGDLFQRVSLIEHHHVVVGQHACPLTTQREVRDLAGRHLLRVDFCFERCRLVVEVDGARWHQDAQRDQRRDNALASLGYRVLRYSWGDVVHEPARTLAEVRAAVTSGTPDFHLVGGETAEAA